MRRAATEAVRRLRDMAKSGELAAICDRHDVELLAVFGSAAQEDTLPDDLDVAVRFGRRGSADTVALVVALQDAVGFEPVDVMDLGGASVVARHRALVGTLALYEREPGLFARTQMAAMLAYMDTAWLRQLDLALMAKPA
jgi:predicted nucleotidyltransferase